MPTREVKNGSERHSAEAAAQTDPQVGRREKRWPSKPEAPELAPTKSGDHQRRGSVPSRRHDARLAETRRPGFVFQAAAGDQ